MAVYFSSPASQFSMVVAPIVQSRGALQKKMSIAFSGRTMVMACNRLLSSSRGLRDSSLRCRHRFFTSFSPCLREGKEGKTHGAGGGGENWMMSLSQRGCGGIDRSFPASHFTRETPFLFCTISPASFYQCGWWRGHAEKREGETFFQRTPNRQSLYSGRLPPGDAKPQKKRTSGSPVLRGIIAGFSLFPYSYHTRGQELANRSFFCPSVSSQLNSSNFSGGFFSTYAGARLVGSALGSSRDSWYQDNKVYDQRINSYTRPNHVSSTMSFTIPGLTLSSSSPSSTHETLLSSNSYVTTGGTNIVMSPRPRPCVLCGDRGQDVHRIQVNGTGRCEMFHDEASLPSSAPSSSSSSAAVVASALSSYECRLYPYIVQDIKTGLSAPPRRMRFASLLAPPPQTPEQQKKVASFLFEELRLRYAGQVGALQVLGAILNQAEYHLKSLQTQCSVAGGRGEVVSTEEKRKLYGEETLLHDKIPNERCFNSKGESKERRGGLDVPLELHGLLRIAQDTLLQQYELLAPNLTTTVRNSENPKTKGMNLKPLATVSSAWKGTSSKGYEDGEGLQVDEGRRRELSGMAINKGDARSPSSSLSCDLLPPSSSSSLLRPLDFYHDFLGRVRALRSLHTRVIALVVGGIRQQYENSQEGIPVSCFGSLDSRDSKKTTVTFGSNRGEGITTSSTLSSRVALDRIERQMEKILQDFFVRNVSLGVLLCHFDNLHTQLIQGSLPIPRLSSPDFSGVLQRSNTRFAAGARSSSSFNSRDNNSVPYSTLQDDRKRTGEESGDGAAFLPSKKHQQSVFSSSRDLSRGHGMHEASGPKRRYAHTAAKTVRRMEEGETESYEDRLRKEDHRRKTGMVMENSGRQAIAQKQGLDRKEITPPLSSLRSGGTGVEPSSPSPSSSSASTLSLPRVIGIFDRYCHPAEQLIVASQQAHAICQSQLGSSISSVRIYVVQNEAGNASAEKQPLNLSSHTFFAGSGSSWGWLQRGSSPSEASGAVGHHRVGHGSSGGGMAGSACTPHQVDQTAPIVFPSSILRYIFAELLKNALRATHERWREEYQQSCADDVRHPLTLPPVDCVVTRVPDGFWVKVSDRGIGMSEAKRKEVFNCLNKDSQAMVDAACVLFNSHSYKTSTPLSSYILSSMKEEERKNRVRVLSGECVSHRNRSDSPVGERNLGTTDRRDKMNGDHVVSSSGHLDESLSDRLERVRMSGCGVGLLMSRAYMKYFGGRLILHSVRGEGTDAYVFIPSVDTRSEMLPSFSSLTGMVPDPKPEDERDQEVNTLQHSSHLLVSEKIDQGSNNIVGEDLAKEKSIQVDSDTEVKTKDDSVTGGGSLSVPRGEEAGEFSNSSCHFSRDIDDVSEDDDDVVPAELLMEHDGAWSNTSLLCEVGDARFA
ncbi:atpase histidine kinase dna gyrase b hsp90 domain-containing protein [Cystoisospora suis]|uniref:Protein-serine/threonine kinase n=1 Tax=Cystoisospora suis TaxID=483139 RepID=A0A2C6KGI4_9APIC|nr:atpase histidine kinase dna gyrase b hsp90 domain-containing protein [Cystoisospora suis]